jgi:phospholipid/cholesterol/gamma-HCH transport system substrate-binding protein
VAAPLRKGRALVLQRVNGLVFLVVIALLVGLTVAVYQKRFTPVVMVELETSRVGNQLTTGADVKVRGLIVGEVRRIRASDKGATLTLAIDEGKAPQVARDVTAQLVPKTLFGEKYVALYPAGTTDEGVQDGDVITMDRSQAAFETAQAVDDLLPLLRTLRPEKLSVTLNALSSALRDRGDRIGANLERTAAYLAQLNPELPTIEQDLKGIADLAETYDRAAPDLLSVIEDLSFSSRAVVDQQEELSALLTTTRDMSDELGAFLTENEERLVRLAADSAPVLAAYARYAPGYPCLLDGIVDIQEEGERVFGGAQPGLHITLELTKDQGKYFPDEQPVYGEDGGPTCFGLGIENAKRPFPITVEVTDGYCDEEEKAPGVQTKACRGRDTPDPSDDGERVRAASDDPALALLGEREALRIATAPVMGGDPSDVPDIATLLFGPMARGTVLGYRLER